MKPAIAIDATATPGPQTGYLKSLVYGIFIKILVDTCNMEYDCGEGLLRLFGMYEFD